MALYIQLVDAFLDAMIVSITSVEYPRSKSDLRSTCMQSDATVLDVNTRPVPGLTNLVSMEVVSDEACWERPQSLKVGRHKAILETIEMSVHLSLLLSEGSTG